VAGGDVHGDVVVAAAQVLHERVAGREERADLWRVRPRIGRDRAVSRPWPASAGLFAYRPAVRGAEGISSSRTGGSTAARPVVTLGRDRAGAPRPAQEPPRGRPVALG
jgi:hypothetical protein